MLAYDFDLKAMHFWVAGSDAARSFTLHYQLLELQCEQFPLAFERKACVQIGEFLAVLTDDGCRCELSGITGLIDRMLAEYPGYMPECLNVVAEQAAQEFGGHIVRRCRPGYH